uniref:Uncharacterized protein n=1 Tax=Arundo donax TaxID=35708 RepID=A0A0A9A900_ARUDO
MIADIFCLQITSLNLYK